MDGFLSYWVFPFALLVTKPVLVCSLGSIKQVSLWSLFNKGFLGTLSTLHTF